MARGNKKMDKGVRKIKTHKRKAVHKMVEALIRGDSEAAAEELKAYMQLATRELVLGEAKDEEMSDDAEEMDDEDDDSEDDDEDDDDSEDDDEDDSDDDMDDEDDDK